MLRKGPHPAEFSKVKAQLVSRKSGEDPTTNKVADLDPFKDAIMLSLRSEAFAAAV